MLFRSYDPQKWVKAREAIKEAIDLAETSGHALYANDAYRNGDNSANRFPEVRSLKPIIEIKAQPPGKNLQNLSLLSGGEKTLTAIALLFAIFSIRPTPFCILDEIDASLDETNIGRYVDYLTEFHKEIQFIVITHRKRTMEMADQLYRTTDRKSVV